MDGRVVGRGGVALRLHVVSQGRALPLAWRVRHSPTGHGPAERHMALVERLRTVSPTGATGVCLGDGECAGLVLWVPYGHEPASAMGGADLAPRCVRRVSPGGEAAGVTRGLCYPRGVWSDHGAVLWGHGVSSALVSGQQADDR